MKHLPPVAQSWEEWRDEGMKKTREVAERRWVGWRGVGGGGGGDEGVGENSPLS